MDLKERDRLEHEVSRRQEKINIAVRGLDRIIAMTSDLAIEDQAKKIQADLRSGR